MRQASKNFGQLSLIESDRNVGSVDMTNEETRDLALSLLAADEESKVIEILTQANLWQRPECWRLYGDRDGNFATIGNQQSRPEAALIEKVVNSVDARLMNECLIRGIDPKSADAPTSIRHAVSRYMERREIQGEIGGTVRSWPKTRQLEQSQFITLAATGSKTSPCLVIVDQGEGQTPSRVPETFLSIDRSNKLRIPFVQGKFNMGGTGVLKFCGKHSVQLLITKRNPKIVQQMQDPDRDADRWSVRILRGDCLQQEFVGANLFVEDLFSEYLERVHRCRDLIDVFVRQEQELVA